MHRTQLKKFIVRKYVMAKSAIDALKKERQIKADDCYIDDEWRKSNEEKTVSIGFKKK